MKKFKSLASTLIKKKNLVLTITVVTAISLGILTGCGAYTNSNAKGDPLMPSTTVESVVETEDETETTTQKPEETTTQKPDEAKDEKTERQNQDADPTEATTQETNDTKPSTQHTNQSTEPTTQAHVHNFKSETYYTTETQTIHHDAVTHTVHHDAITHQETTYTTETQDVEHSGYACSCCGSCYESRSAAQNCCGVGYSDWIWTTTETVQVPYTETVVDQAAYDETVTDKPAWDEKVEVQVAHTREVCSCGATK